MADVNKPNRMKILSKDQKKSLLIGNNIFESISQLCQSNVSWSQEEISSLDKKCLQMFQKSILQNIDIDTSSQAEPSEREVALRRRLNEDVMPVLDTGVLDTVKRRKHLPYECAHWQAKVCKHRVLTVENQEVEVKAEPVSAPSSAPALRDVTRGHVTLSSSCKDSYKRACSVSRSLQSCEAALRMLGAHLHTCTDHVLLSAARDDVTTSALTPLKRRLHELQHAPPSVSVTSQNSKHASVTSQMIPGKRQRLYGEFFPSVVIETV